MDKIILLTLCGLAVVYGYGESETYVSRKHEGDYKYGIDHHFHGHWKGSSHPHGYAGLGDGHGDYKTADAKFINFLPQSLVGGKGGHGGHKEHHEKATSFQNFNLKSIKKW